ncbi:MAG TPA: hypothetical protein VH186_29165 [Chloroflexia bacterium]|nr:hypothetical protein [Chloroflexia bacterium]
MAVTKLRIELEPTPGYHETPQEPYNIWGVLSLVLLKDNERETLFELENTWYFDLANFKEWFLECYEDILTEPMLIQGMSMLPSESLAQAHARLIDREFPEEQEEEMFEFDSALYNYRRKHNLRFGLPGVTMPAIYIGLNHGSGEVSVFNEDEQWAYQINLEDFCTDLRQKLEQLEVFKIGESKVPERRIW